MRTHFGYLFCLLLLLTGCGSNSEDTLSPPSSKSFDTELVASETGFNMVNGVSINHGNLIDLNFYTAKSIEVNDNFHGTWVNLYQSKIYLENSDTPHEISESISFYHNIFSEKSKSWSWELAADSNWNDTLQLYDFSLDGKTGDGRIVKTYGVSIKLSDDLLELGTIKHTINDGGNESVKQYPLNAFLIDPQGRFAAHSDDWEDTGISYFLNYLSDSDSILISISGDDSVSNIQSDNFSIQSDNSRTNIESVVYSHSASHRTTIDYISLFHDEQSSK